MGLKNLSLFTAYELKQELKLTDDPTMRAYIRKLIQQHAAAELGEYAAEALEYPSRFAALEDGQLTALWPYLTDDFTRDALVKQLWTRGVPVPAMAGDEP